MSGYCDVAPGHPLHGPYHDHEYGFPLADETALFERLVLEIMQAGLNWELVLRKREGMRAALAGFAVDALAELDERVVAALLADERIVRNRLKVGAIVANARTVRALRASHGGFASWLAAQQPLGRAEWVRLFKRTFRFTGGEITGEFLQSIGYLPGAHRESCPVFGRIAALAPPWMRGAMP
ncbi:MAG: DNA-3-methyladenine glycosylase I [Holophagales bacterium]|nr:MAG: DNA-3-methyladenine glycosylase I [Holophagales bacterium]